jgi:chromate transport protein ChrA
LAPKPEHSAGFVPLAALYAAFLKASLCGFGGGLLVWTRRVIVEERQWMSDAEFADTLSLCQFLPGAPFSIAAPWLTGRKAR